MKKEEEVFITAPEKVGYMRPRLIQWRNIHGGSLKNEFITIGQKRLLLKLHRQLHLLKLNSQRLLRPKLNHQQKHRRQLDLNKLIKWTSGT